MHTFTDLIENEHPIDVILALVRSGITHARLEGLYRAHGWVHLHDSRRLLDLLRLMKAEGHIVEAQGAWAQGPSWQAPAFLREGRYTFATPGAGGGETKGALLAVSHRPEVGLQP